MNTKLTLSINKRTIEKAKRYAKKKNQSLSSIIEDYLNVITDKETVKDLEISPNVLELLGIIKSDEPASAKELYRKHLEEKYLK
ncbi:MAG: hypothetical protein FMNOHCHN_00420 [Ignavibacteriaceae bacterium]|nr:hypothetical protein [Ignavibacteriaceae bacterium]MCK6613680.1 DUF6364 family protein [Ignavibacteriaceae bacterium]